MTTAQLVTKEPVATAGIVTVIVTGAVAAFGAVERWSPETIAATTSSVMAIVTLVAGLVARGKVTPNTVVDDLTQTAALIARAGVIAQLRDLDAAKQSPTSAVSSPSPPPP